ncbi:head completion/stabilization protein [Pseudomonas protegens]|uniref:head completion/stabilization protein n=1 Tax=Pseudomonas protegens TaxID=380021 RepID=UPI000F479C38|nr:head completion/stabilization protein [Pseudomonas protegens]ROL87991.1 head completion/stabilization protein [Pseudomonas protegens]ROL94688.1 head completion/stabilization protein [Pseudomonas protegens]ROM04009.1 head completion/stabilization protein [Pseudomonas protegens]ROM05817.1 head completion/stabilization protein [Pseudomonas protegens]
MSGFVAGGSTPSGHINTDPFWPSIDLDQLRATLRIDSSVTPARLETAVINAAISVNRELDDWRIAQQAAGYAELKDVPSTLVKDESAQVHLYRRAIEAGVGAEVCERYRSYDSTNTGNRKAEELTPNIDDYHRDQRWAIRDFLRTKRTTVELI